MSKKILKIIIIVIIAIAFIMGVMYLIDFNRMKEGKEVLFSTWGFKYAPIVNDVKSNEIINTKYSKTIENIKMELNIPNEWKYEEVQKNEENDFYKYALKLYKNSKEQYAMLCFYKDKFAVCGTGRTTEDIILNDGSKATIGYYDGSTNWSDITFYEGTQCIVVLNYGLVDNDAKEVIEIIKTINIINNQNEYSFCGIITQVEENIFFVEPDENEEIRKSADKVMVGKLKIDTNLKFEVGERVKITYDGDVMETYPVQIKAIKYEAID